jgi:programmed cell death protein 5
MILRTILTTEAKERLGRIKVARPELAEAIENQLIILAQSGQLKTKINDEQLQMLLTRLIPKKRDINIKRR